MKLVSNLLKFKGLKAVSLRFEGRVGEGRRHQGEAPQELLPLPAVWSAGEDRAHDGSPASAVSRSRRALM